MSKTIVKRATKRVWDAERQCFIKPPTEPAQGHTPTLCEAALDEINRLNKHIDKLIRNSADLEQERADLLAVLERARQDINWMLNNRQFLNGHVFEYIETAFAKAEGRAQ